MISDGSNNPHRINSQLFIIAVAHIKWNRKANSHKRNNDAISSLHRVGINVISKH